MAIINTKTGYSGFTVDGTGGKPIDQHGRVDRCIITLSYPTRFLDAKVTISNGADDWGAQMGDGTIIPLSNPVILYTNRDNAIIQFDMNEVYAANSPCVLVYRSTTANIGVTDTEEAHEFVANSVSGHFAFTVEGYGGDKKSNGYVNRLLATIPFPVQVTNVEFSITSDPSHWGAHMGDGNLIPLRDPKVIFTNMDNAVVQFTLDTPYPSNSPCILVYRSKDAKYSVTIKDIAAKFIPVTDITNIPTEMMSGVPIDLSGAEIKPFDSSKREIVWSVVSGSAKFTGNTLLSNGAGNVQIKATIVGGINDGKNDYVKTFNIKSNENVIKIISQPQSNISLVVKEIDMDISVLATSNSGVINYKWYINSTASTSGATEVGSNESHITIPPTTAVGTYYYFCQLTSPGATLVNTKFTKVDVYEKLTGVSISPRITSMALMQKRQLTGSQIPAGAKDQQFVFTTTDDKILQVTEHGLLYAISGGSATITMTDATGKFSDKLTISIAPHVPVSIIENVFTEIETDTEYTLTGTVKPTNATSKDISWSVVNAGTTGAKIVNNVLTTVKAGFVTIKGTVIGGASLTSDYEQDFQIKVNQKFIPVSKITFAALGDELRAYETIVLNTTITPENATNKEVILSIKNAGTTGAKINNKTLSTTAEGTCVIQATVINGKSPTENFVTDISLKILPKWVSVENIINIPDIYADVSLPVKLAGSVYPQNATMKNITYKLINGSSANAVLSKDNVLSIDYENVVWWKKNPDATPPDYLDQWIEQITDSIVIEITVKDGIRKGENFVLTFNMGIQSPEPPSIHIPITKMELLCPSIIRAHRPILMSEVVKTPWNATNGDIKISFLRAATDAPGFGISFKPSEETPEYWYNEYGIKMVEDYDWERNSFYTYSFEDILAKVSFTVLNGNEDGTAYLQEDFIQFLPEYIPVKNIKNIPTSVPYNAKIYLAPEFDTNFFIETTSTETYDVEIPSYSKINWTIASAGYTGATFTNDILSFTRSGTCVIQAEVPQGTHEAYTWYDKTFNATSYKKQFTINVTSAESNFSSPIVTLTLTNGNTVKIYKVWEFYNLCNNLPSNTSITAGGTTFRKDQIREVKFWDLVPHFSGTDKTVPITNMSLTSNTLNTFTKPSSSIPTSEFSTYVSDTIEDGCTKFTINIPDINDPNAPESKSFWRLPDHVFLKPNGEIVKLSYVINNYPIDTPSIPGNITSGQFKLFIHGATTTNSGYGIYNQTIKEININAGKDPDGLIFEKWLIIEDPYNVASFDDISSSSTKLKINTSGATYSSFNITIGAIRTTNPATAEKREFVINKEHIDVKFISDTDTIDIETFNDEFMETSKFERFDNGYIKIPKRCLLGDDGTVYIPPEVSGNDIYYSDPNYVAILNIYGIFRSSAFHKDDYTPIPPSNTGSVGSIIYYPKGTKLGDGCIILPSGYTSNGIESYQKVSTLPAGYIIPYPATSIFNETNKDWRIITTTSVSFKPFRSTIYTLSGYKFIKSSSGDGILTSDGYVIKGNTNVESITDSDGVTYQTSTKQILPLDSSKVTISPSNSTGKLKDVKWIIKNSINNNSSGKGKIMTFPSPLGTSIMSIIVPGSTNEVMTIEGRVENGVGWNGQDYVKSFIVNIGNVAGFTSTTVTAINTNYDEKLVLESRQYQYVDLTAGLVGINTSSISNSNIRWSLSGNYSRYTYFTNTYSSTTTGTSARLQIHRYETDGRVLTINISAGGYTRTVKINIVSAYEPQPAITSLYNFGCNFVNLTKIDRIPDVIDGDNCLRNFLSGCTSFNQKIEIPSHIEGSYILRNFLGGCTSFNQPITIPNGITGNHCLDRFLSGCRSFNQPITIPDGVTGDYCLMRFLEGCVSFNQPITLPSNVSGKQCLDNFLLDCETWNQDLTIPDLISGVAALRGFLRNTYKMTSTITISEQAANNCNPNGITLACWKRDVAYDVGVKVAGTGAEIFKSKCPNMLTTIPLRNLK